MSTENASGFRSEYHVRPMTTGSGFHFFGYYDKTPWNASGRFLLGMKTTFQDHPPDASSRAEIGLVAADGSFGWTPIAETLAWNWQQGCMLQWHPILSETHVVYNIRDGNRFASVFLDVSTGEARQLPLPIYALAPDGAYALSTNFSRIADTRPGYGYAGIPDKGRYKEAPDDDGIYWMDFETGASKMILSYAQLASFDPLPSMKGAKHWFNHLQINTDSSRFAFLHRWSGEPDAMPWRTRMLTANPDGSVLCCLAQDDRVSHYDWKDKETILVWARQKGLGDHYYLIKDHNAGISILGEGLLTADGHCSWSPDRHCVLTDTYPDRERMRHLLLYLPRSARKIELGAFFAPPQLDGEIRCDLHPRWNRDGSKICFDSVHTGERQIYVLDLGGNPSELFGETSRLAFTRRIFGMGWTTRLAYRSRRKWNSIRPRVAKRIPEPLKRFLRKIKG